MQVSVDRSLKRAKACAKVGDVEGARLLIADVLRRHPANKRAVAALEGLFEQVRQDLAVRRAEAAKLYKSGRYREAADLATALADADPDDLQSFELLGNALVKLGRWTEAVPAFERLVRARPHDLAAANALTLALVQGGKYRAALKLSDQILAIDPANARALHSKANVLRALDRHAEAAQAFEAATETAPDWIEAHVHLGICLSEMGEVDAARERFKVAMAIDPDFVDAHRHHAMVHRFAPGDPAIGRLRELAQRTTGRDRAELLFALGKAYDDVGDCPAAFEAFAAANRIFRVKRPYDPSADRADVARFLHAAAPGPLVEPPKDAARPIFIVGMPRSGTSLVEQIVQAHPLVGALGEVDELRLAVAAEWDRSGPMTVDTLRTIAERYRAFAAERTAQPVFTDKMLLNHRLVGVIARALPDAVILNVTRTPEASCWSIFRSGLTGASFAYGHDLTTLGGAYNLYRATMRAWDALYPDRVRHVDYEALVASPETQIRALLDACNLPFDPACLQSHRSRRAVRTASALQVRAPIYAGSSAAWERYAPRLGPLREALAAPWPNLAEVPVSVRPPRP